MTRKLLGSRFLVMGLAFASSFGTPPELAQAQQVPIPQTASQVPGPAPGTPMTKAYGLSVGLAACQCCEPLRGFRKGTRRRSVGWSDSGRVQQDRDADRLH